MIGIFRFCFPYLQRQKWKLFIYITICLFLGIMSFINPYIIGKFIDALTMENNMYLLLLLGILVLAAIVQVIVGYARDRLYNFIQISLAIDLNSEVIHHVQRLSTKTPRDTAFLNQQINADSNYIIMFCMNTLQNILINSILIAVPLIVAFRINVYLGIIILVLSLVYYLVYSLLRKLTFERSLETLNMQSEFFSRLNEQLFNTRFVQIHGIAKNFINRLRISAERVIRAVLRAQTVEYGYKGTDGIISCGVLVATLIFGGISVNRGKLSLGELTMLLSYVTLLINSMSFFFLLGQDVQEISASKSRLEEILGEKVQSNGSAILPSIEEIKCENLSFAYENEVIIKEVSAVFKKGKRYAVIGKNGAGKSTFVDLLLGMYIDEYTGSIMYNNVSINDLDMLETRNRLIGVSEQEPNLLPESIGYNLLLDEDKSVNTSELNEYISLMGLQDFFDNLEEGIDTIINEKSSNLSGGEKQKLSIIRVLIKNPDVLVLDEPTSAMDSESASRIINYIKEYSKDKIVIYITHDDELIESCDEIVRL